MVHPIRPLHISSQAPEVVAEQQSPYLTSPDKYFVRSYSGRRTSNNPTSPFNKQYDNIPLQEFPLPRRAFAPSVVSFFIGGGIGGGIGGWLGKHNNPSSKTSKSESTGTSSGCSPTITEFVDSAGCPNVNNTTYTTPAPSVEFRIACATDLTSSQGEDIELANGAAPTLDNCLDSCARYNNGQCLAATWIQFSPNYPEMNSRCFLKANAGTRIPLNYTGTIATSGFRIS